MPFASPPASRAARDSDLSTPQHHAQTYADQVAWDTARSLEGAPETWELPWLYPALACECAQSVTCDACRAYYGTRWRSLPRDYSPRYSRLDAHAEALAAALQAGASYATLAARYGVSRTAMRYYCLRRGYRVSRRNTTRRVTYG